MKRIFGIMFVEARDLDVLRSEIKQQTTQTVERELKVFDEKVGNKFNHLSQRTHDRCGHHERRVAEAVDFIFRHLPMKRYRKELRQHMDALTPKEDARPKNPGGGCCTEPPHISTQCCEPTPGKQTAMRIPVGKGRTEPPAKTNP